MLQAGWNADTKELGRIEEIRSCRSQKKGKQFSKLAGMQAALRWA